MRLGGRTEVWLPRSRKQFMLISAGLNPSRLTDGRDGSFGSFNVRIACAVQSRQGRAGQAGQANFAKRGSVKTGC